MWRDGCRKRASRRRGHVRFMPGALVRHISIPEAFAGLRATFDALCPMLQKWRDCLGLDGTWLKCTVCMGFSWQTMEVDMRWCSCNGASPHDESKRMIDVEGQKFGT